MFYVIPDTFLKVSLNTNKTGHHVLRYTWHSVESDVKHHKTNSRPSLIKYDMILNVIFKTSENLIWYLKRNGNGILSSVYMIFVLHDS